MRVPGACLVSFGVVSPSNNGIDAHCLVAGLERDLGARDEDGDVPRGDTRREEVCEREGVGAAGGAEDKTVVERDCGGNEGEIVGCEVEWWWGERARDESDFGGHYESSRELSGEEHQWEVL